jgi:hypothetical protein
LCPVETALASRRSIGQNPWFWSLILLFWLVLLAWMHGYDGLYGQDAYEHLNYARDLQRNWQDGTPLGMYQWPRLYAFFGALWPCGDPQFWMKALAMIGAAVTLGMMIKLLQASWPDRRWMAPLVFAFVGLSPLVVRNSLSVMADMPSLALTVSALWLGSRYMEHGKTMQLLGAMLLSGAAIFMRYPVALALGLPMLYWAWNGLKQRDWAGLALALPALLVASLPQLLLPQAVGEGLTQPFQHQHFIQWTPANYFGRSFFQKDGYNEYPVFNLAAALGLFWHPRYFGLGLLGLLGVLFWKRWQLPRPSWIALGSILIHVLFLAGIPFQNPRFLLPVLPFAAILLAGCWVIGWEKLLKTNGLRISVFALLVAAQLGLGWWSSRQLFAVNANERQIAKDLTTVAGDGLYWEPGDEAWVTWDRSWIPEPWKRLYELSFQAMLKARQVPLEAISIASTAQWRLGSIQPASICKAVCRHVAHEELGYVARRSYLGHAKNLEGRLGAV